MFLKWLKKIIEVKNLYVSFEYCFEELKGVLRKFYVCVRKLNGE